MTLISSNHYILENGISTNNMQATWIPHRHKSHYVQQTQNEYKHCPFYRKNDYIS